MSPSRRSRSTPPASPPGCTRRRFAGGRRRPVPRPAGCSRPAADPGRHRDPADHPGPVHGPAHGGRHGGRTSRLAGLPGGRRGDTVHRGHSGLDESGLRQCCADGPPNLSPDHLGMDRGRIFRRTADRVLRAQPHPGRRRIRVRVGHHDDRCDGDRRPGRGAAGHSFVARHPALAWRDRLHRRGRRDPADAAGRRHAAGADRVLPIFRRRSCRAQPRWHPRSV